MCPLRHHDRDHSSYRNDRAYARGDGGRDRDREKNDHGNDRVRNMNHQHYEHGDENVLEQAASANPHHHLRQAASL